MENGNVGEIAAVVESAELVDCGHTMALLNCCLVQIDHYIPSQNKRVDLSEAHFTEDETGHATRCPNIFH
jgi:hypothetical protein